VSLLASCQLHDILPWPYLRDIFCLLPRWPVQRVLDLAPAYWSKTAAREDVQRTLAANVLRRRPNSDPLRGGMVIHFFDVQTA
jgi:hypothetical protein